MSARDKVYYIIHVMKSCKSVDQMANAILWSNKVSLGSEEIRILAFVCSRDIPLFDVALRAAREMMYG